MVFPTDDILLGPRTWGKRPATDGIIWHTTEYQNFLRSEAIRCAVDQSRRTPTGGWVQPGSYNFIIYDGGLLLTVPYLEGSGGLNPDSDAWAPERFEWLKRLLPARAYTNPTMHHLQAAFSGKTSDILAGRMPQNMYKTAADLTKWAEAEDWCSDNVVFSGHLNWQSNRSDPGWPTIEAILDLLTPPAVVVPPPANYYTLYTQEVAKVTSLVTKIQAKNAGIERVKDRILTEHEVNIRSLDWIRDQ